VRVWGRGLACRPLSQGGCGCCASAGPLRHSLRTICTFLGSLWARWLVCDWPRWENNYLHAACRFQLIYRARDCLCSTQVVVNKIKSNKPLFLNPDYTMWQYAPGTGSRCRNGLYEVTETSFLGSKSNLDKFNGGKLLTQAVIAIGLLDATTNTCLVEPDSVVHCWIKIQIVTKPKLYKSKKLSGSFGSDDTTDIKSVTFKFQIYRIRLVIEKKCYFITSIIGNLERWDGHVMRRDESHITKSVMSMNVDEHPSRGRPKKS
jgi:hypothetical protein